MAHPDFVATHVRLPRPLSDRLDDLARRPGVFKSRIVAEAVRAFLDRKGSDELEQRFAMRLDRISNQLERIERKLNPISRIERNGRIALESHALFVRYMLAVNAPLPEGDEASRAIARDRFNAFVERVARQLAGGRLTLVPEEDDQ